GEVANSWRRERWDSLRLLTPNWQSRLPGLRYEGPDPDGYMTMGEVTAFIASGACNQPTVPGFSAAVPAFVEQLTPFDYRDPAKLPDGGVLVVGASATGVQLAAELQRSGRPVTLSVGEHVRLPRTYRGRDVLWWMDASGVWGQRY